VSKKKKKKKAEPSGCTDSALDPAYEQVVKKTTGGGLAAITGCYRKRKLPMAP
jgi:hypothetical protein